MASQHNANIVRKKMTLRRQTDQWLQVDDNSIRYWKRGDASTAVLLIHGMGCSCLEWSENIEFLAENATVIAVDMLGFGQSDKPKKFDYSPRNQAITLIKFLQQLQINQVHLVGNSFGGRVALEMALELGEQAKSLTLVASGGGATDVPLGMRLLSLPIIGELLNKPNQARHQIGWESVFINKSKISQERIDEKYSDALLPGAQASTLATLRSMIDIHGFKKKDIAQLHQRIKELEIRTLIVWGDADPLLPVHHAQKFQALLQNSTQHIFKACGHAPQIEYPELFNQTLKEFMQ
jgi:pimeloyl-ACP methyl ester carboxylesterase